MAETLFEFEARARKFYLKRLVEKNDWNIRKSAKEAGCNRTHLHKLINEYGIRRPQKKHKHLIDMSRFFRPFPERTRVARAVAVAGGSDLPSWLSGKSVNEWVQLESLSTAVTDRAIAGAANGVFGNVKNVLDAWGGGAVRSSGSYYILHGGGHADYGGNEIYTLKLSDNSPAWIRKWDGTPNVSIIEADPYYSDGNPASMHTYHDLQYDNGQDKLYRVGGSWYVTPSGLNSEFNSWNWEAANWNANGTHPDVPSAPVAGDGIAITATGDKVYWWSNAKRHIWDRLTNSWTFSDTFSSYQHIEGVLVHDPVNNCCWAIGGDNATANQVHKWDLSDDSISTVTCTGTGTSVLQSRLTGDYCTETSKIHLYYLGSVYVFDPSALTVVTQTMTGTGPLSSYTGDNGTYGKFRYVPELKGFVVQPVYAANTFFYRAA